MSTQLQGLTRSLHRRLAAVAKAVGGWTAVELLRAIRFLPRKQVAAGFALIMRTLGPFLREHRVGRANLVAAFPEKPAAEIEQILSGVWDNLGRYAAEFAHIDRLTNDDPSRPDDDIVADPAISERFHRLRLDGKPALVFAAHLANWELPALVAGRHKLDAAVLYRRPNMPMVNDAILKIRSNIMGTLVPASLDAPVKLLHLLEAGKHVAMLVDQHSTKGVEVTFFGRRCRVNPLIAQLARHIDCPIHGTRVIRRTDRNRFFIEMTEAIEPKRDGEGRVDVEGTMQVIMTVVEAWVRDHPDQWLWLHRLWR